MLLFNFYEIPLVESHRRRTRRFSSLAVYLFIDYAGCIRFLIPNHIITASHMRRPTSKHRWRLRQVSNNGVYIYSLLIRNIYQFYDRNVTSSTSISTAGWFASESQYGRPSGPPDGRPGWLGKEGGATEVTRTVAGLCYWSPPVRRPACAALSALYRLFGNLLATLQLIPRRTYNSRIIERGERVTT